MFEIFYAIEPSLPPSRKTFQDVNKKAENIYESFPRTDRRAQSKALLYLPSTYQINMDLHCFNITLLEAYLVDV